MLKKWGLLLILCMIVHFSFSMEPNALPPVVLMISKTTQSVIIHDIKPLLMKHHVLAAARMQLKQNKDRIARHFLQKYGPGYEELVKLGNKELAESIEELGALLAMQSQPLIGSLSSETYSNLKQESLHEWLALQLTMEAELKPQ